MTPKDRQLFADAMTTLLAMNTIMMVIRETRVFAPIQLEVIDDLIKEAKDIHKRFTEQGLTTPSE